jgi:phage terminase small subunit
MTPRQQRFVEEYLVDLNATQAAIRAGYSARTANEQGARLLANASVAAAIQAAQQARSDRMQITHDHRRSPGPRQPKPRRPRARVICQPPE